MRLKSIHVYIIIASIIIKVVVQIICLCHAIIFVYFTIEVSAYFAECSYRRLLPIYLIVHGVLTLILVLLCVAYGKYPNNECVKCLTIPYIVFVLFCCIIGQYESLLFLHISAYRFRNYNRSTCSVTCVTAYHYTHAHTHANMYANTPTHKQALSIA